MMREGAWRTHPLRPHSVWAHIENLEPRPFVSSALQCGDVIEVLGGLINERSAPSFLRFDNGPELVSEAILQWIVEHEPPSSNKRPECATGGR